METSAVDQLRRVAELEGVVAAIGMPDLHPGKGAPIGAAIVSRKRFYPHLAGNDIGCGMTLFQTDVKTTKVKLDKWEKKLCGLETPWDGDVHSWLEQRSVGATCSDDALGTIGGGNHFAELQRIDEVRDRITLDSLDIDPDRLQLLVHSGSRGYGEAILRSLDRSATEGLVETTEAAGDYFAEHDNAVKWAAANRELIAHRFVDQLGATLSRRLDACHNAIVATRWRGAPAWLHRKGAAPSDSGAVVVPGSRGAPSYVVAPTGPQEDNGFSLAHGAGRKWTRTATRERLRTKYRARQLARTAIRSRVICEDKDLLYEEAPEAYKKIDEVVSDLVEFGLVRVVAILTPLLSYKVRRR